MIGNSKFIIVHIHGISDKDGNKYKYLINEKVLFYEIGNNDYLVIRIKANDNKNISEEQVKQLTNFVINV